VLATYLLGTEPRPAALALRPRSRPDPAATRIGPHDDHRLELASPPPRVPPACALALCRCCGAVPRPDPLRRLSWWRSFARQRSPAVALEPCYCCAPPSPALGITVASPPLSRWALSLSPGAWWVGAPLNHNPSWRTWAGRGLARPPPSGGFPGVPPRPRIAPGGCCCCQLLLNRVACWPSNPMPPWPVVRACSMPCPTAPLQPCARRRPGRRRPAAPPWNRPCCPGLTATADRLECAPWRSAPLLVCSVSWPGPRNCALSLQSCNFTALPALWLLRRDAVARSPGLRALRHRWGMPSRSSWTISWPWAAAAGTATWAPPRLLPVLCWWRWPCRIISPASCCLAAAAATAGHTWPAGAGPALRRPWCHHPGWTAAVPPCLRWRAPPAVRCWCYPGLVACCCAVWARAPAVAVTLTALAAAVRGSVPGHHRRRWPCFSQPRVLGCLLLEALPKTTADHPLIVRRQKWP